MEASTPSTELGRLGVDVAVVGKAYPHTHTFPWTWTEPFVTFTIFIRLWLLGNFYDTITTSKLVTGSRELGMEWGNQS